MDKLTIYLLIQLAFSSRDVLCMDKSFEVLKEDNKITGGNETIIQVYPYNAFLRLYDGRVFRRCGGSIISVNWILTSARCLQGVQLVHVRIGSTFTNEGGTHYTSTAFQMHPLFTPASERREYDYDVGLLNIIEGMMLDGINARAVQIAELFNKPQNGIHVIITGWGLTNQNDTQYPDQLHAAVTHVVDREECSNFMGGAVTLNQFCAGEVLRGDNPDICQGDYGGPAVDQATGKQLGIASYSNGCGNINDPGVFTRIGSPTIRMYIMAFTGI